MRFGDDDEANREMERARREDSRRATSARPIAQLLGKRPPEDERILRCVNCGYESADRGWRMHPDGGGVVCAGRHDETGAPVDCFSRLEQAKDALRAAEATRTSAIVRAAKKRGGLTAEERGFLASFANGRSTIRALEEKFRVRRREGDEADDEL